MTVPKTVLPPAAVGRKLFATAVVVLTVGEGVLVATSAVAEAGRRGVAVLGTLDGRTVAEARVGGGAVAEASVVAAAVGLGAATFAVSASVGPAAGVVAEAKRISAPVALAWAPVGSGARTIPTVTVGNTASGAVGASKVGVSMTAASCDISVVAAGRFCKAASARWRR